MIRRLYLSLTLLIVSLAACAEEIEQALVQEKVLVPWQVITGGRLATRLDTNGFPLPGELAGFSTFVYPSALAVHEPDIYIADSGARKVYRFDAALQILSVMPGIAAMPGTRLQVGADQSLFVLDTGNSAILHYSRGGQKLGMLGDSLPGTSLGDFVVDASLGQIVASDRLNQRLIILSPLGGMSNYLAMHGEDSFTALGALAGNRGITYAVDRDCSCVAVIDSDGKVRDRTGQGLLHQPNTLVADRQGHLFVADGFDQTLKVFKEGKLIASYQSQALHVTEISAMAVDESILYIADGPGAQVAVFRIHTSRRLQK